MQTGQKENPEQAAPAGSAAEGLLLRLDHLISHIPDAVYSSRPDAIATTTFVSKRWEEWTGYMREEFYRKPELWSQCVHPEDRTGALEDYMRACREKSGYCHHYRLIHKDTGRIRWVKDQGTPWFDEDGKVLHFEGVVTDITQEKEYEARLCSTRDAWVSIFESISDSVLVLDADCRILDANRASVDLLGIPKDQLLNRHCYELFHQTDRPPENCPHIKLLATKEPCYEEMDVEAFGRVFSVSVSPVFDSEGNISKTIHIAKDITEQRQSQKELQASEMRFRTAFNQAYQFSILMDLEGTILEVNDLCAQAFNLDPQSMIGKSVYTLLDNDELPYERAAFEEDVQIALARGSAKREVCYLGLNGRQRIAERTLSVIRDAAGKPVYMLNQGLDITERKRSEEEVERLAKFPSENPNPVMRILPDGQLVYHNAASQCIMDSWYICTYMKIPEDILVIVKNVLSSGIYENREFTCGDDVFLLNFVPVPEMNYVNIYGFNITARKKAEKEREILLKDLSRKNEELESIIYVSSHDLRSPLINISGYGNELELQIESIEQALKRQLPDRELTPELDAILHREIPESLSFISSGTSKMSQLLDGLLRLCRINRNDFGLMPVDMQKLTGNVVHYLQQQVVQEPLEIEIKPLPGCIADPDRLGEVLSNLLDNAVKYSDPTRPLKIIIEGEQASGKSIYRIRDNGRGIRAEYHAKIFEIFHQLNPDSDVEGEGLGLTIAKRLMEYMNGEIAVQSECGQGSTFIVTLPAR